MELIVREITINVIVQLLNKISNTVYWKEAKLLAQEAELDEFTVESENWLSW